MFTSQRANLTPSLPCVQLPGGPPLLVLRVIPTPVVSPQPSVLLFLEWPIENSTQKLFCCPRELRFLSGLTWSHFLPKMSTCTPLYFCLFLPGSYEMVLFFPFFFFLVLNDLFPCQFSHEERDFGPHAS